MKFLLTGSLFYIFSVFSSAVALDITEIEWEHGILEITNPSHLDRSVLTLEITDGQNVFPLEPGPILFRARQVRVYRLSFLPLSPQGQVWLHVNRTGDPANPDSIESGVIWGASAAGSEPAESVASLRPWVWPDASEFLSATAFETGQSVRRIPLSSEWSISEETWGRFGFQSDLLIGKTAASSGGDGVINSTGLHQRLRLYSWGVRRVKYFSKVQNDGESHDLIWTKGQRTNSNFKIRWIRPGIGNVTSAITAGTNFSLDPSDEVLLQSVIRPKSKIRDRNRSYRAWLQSRSVNDNASKDYSYALIKKSKSRPRRKPRWSTSNALPPFTDANQNAIADLAEALAIGLPDSLDSDGDGVSDKIEVLSGRDPNLDESLEAQNSQSSLTTGLQVFTPVPAW